MSKKNKTPLGIFIESIGLYFSNFDKFVKYMTFPILGQFGGLGLILLLTVIFKNHAPNIDNLNILLLLIVLITLPGLLIFTKAFWEYLVAYGAVNSMLSNMLKSGKVYDFEAHTELIKRRTVSFVMLWFLIGIFSIIAVFPLFWVPACVFAIFFILVFQVFTYEPELSPIGCVKKSFVLIKGHFASTFLLIALAGALTYIFVPQIVISILQAGKLPELFAKIFIPIINEFPLQDLNNILTQAQVPAISNKDIALFITNTIIAQILIMYTLPLRSILWSMWYQELNGSLNSISNSKEKKGQKPSERLMKETNKKYSSKKLDKNILKRAENKDND